MRALALTALLLLLGACASAPQAPSAQDRLARVSQRLDASTAEMTDCFRREVGAAFDQLNGRVVVRFEIDADGFVQQLDLIESQLNNPAADLCVADTIRRLFFEDWVGQAPARLTKPFSFTAGKS
jgi:hypothetical protein